MCSWSTLPGGRMLALSYVFRASFPFEGTKIWWPMRHVLRLPPHHPVVRWVLGSASSGTVVVEDARLAIICNTQSLFVGILHFLRCPKVAVQEVLCRREVGTVTVDLGFCYNL